jgi:calcium-dependent protein kinase
MSIINSLISLILSTYNLQMGCLCSTKPVAANQILTRSVTISSSLELCDFPFVVKPFFRNFHAEYKLENSPIGSGQFGEIRLCRQLSTNNVFAAKIISKSGLISKRHLESQFKLMQQVDHPSIVKLSDFLEDGPNYYIVMDYVKGPDLLSLIQRYGIFPEKSAAKIIKQLFSSLAYLHKRGIVHRDVKAENLIIQENKGEMIVKLIDFDTVVKKESEEKLKGVHGTVYYMAPEVIDGRHDEKCDIWSAGVLLYSLITGKFPFGGRNDQEIMENIAEKQVNAERFSKFSRELADLLKKMLEKNGEMRISAAEAFCHPWIRKNTAMSKVPRGINLDNSCRSWLVHGLKTWAVRFIVSTKQVADLHMLFLELDKDFNGRISKNQLLGYFGNSFEGVNKVTEIGGWVLDEGIGYFEFLSLEACGKIMQKYEKKIFDVLDKERIGKVEVNRLFTFLESKLQGGYFCQGVKGSINSEFSDKEIFEMLCE